MTISDVCYESSTTNIGSHEEHTDAEIILMI